MLACEAEEVPEPKKPDFCKLQVQIRKQNNNFCIRSPHGLPFPGVEAGHGGFVCLLMLNSSFWMGASRETMALLGPPGPEIPLPDQFPFSSFTQK